MAKTKTKTKTKTAKLAKTENAETSAIVERPAITTFELRRRYGVAGKRLRDVLRSMETFDDGVYTKYAWNANGMPVNSKHPHLADVIERCDSKFSVADKTALDVSKIKQPKTAKKS